MHQAWSGCHRPPRSRSRTDVSVTSAFIVALILASALVVFISARCRQQGTRATGFAEPVGVHECGKLDAADELVVWDATAARCSPNVCGGAWLPEIADLDGAVPAAMLCDLKLFDTAAARECLQNKRLLLLGDSTMTETAHDLAILLSGIATDSTALHQHVLAATRVPGQASMRMPRLSGRGGIDTASPVEVEFYATHRHFDISLPSLNISIVHRFNGEFSHTAGSLVTLLACMLFRSLQS